MKLSKYIFFLFCLQFTILYAQEPDFKNGSINDQFDYIIKKSNDFNEKGQTYEVVNLDLLLSVRKQALDSISVVQAKFEKARTSIQPLQEEIKTLENKLSETQKSLALIKEEKDDMFLLGMPMSKGSYATFMWSIIAVLIVFLALFVYRFKNSNAVTKNAEAALIDLENEFKEHRTMALEREQKVMRQLLDERNKQKNG